jgi:hypothetical protein
LIAIVPLTVTPKPGFTTTICPALIVSVLPAEIVRLPLSAPFTMPENVQLILIVKSPPDAACGQSAAYAVPSPAKPNASRAAKKTAVRIT